MTMATIMSNSPSEIRDAYEALLERIVWDRIQGIVKETYGR